MPLGHFYNVLVIKCPTHLIKFLCALPLCLSYVRRDFEKVPLNRLSPDQETAFIIKPYQDLYRKEMSFIEAPVLVSLITKIYKKLPLDFYILCLLEHKIQKQALKSSSKMTWQKIYTKAYLKASLSSLLRSKEINTNQSIDCMPKSSHARLVPKALARDEGVRGKGDAFLISRTTFDAPVLGGPERCPLIMRKMQKSKPSQKKDVNKTTSQIKTKPVRLSLNIFKYTNTISVSGKTPCITSCTSAL